MLKLNNIKLTERYIEAHYTPEDSEKMGYIKLDRKTGQVESKPVKGYENTYPLMAKQGLERILTELKLNNNYKIPSERLVMWY